MRKAQSADGRARQSTDGRANRRARARLAVILANRPASQSAHQTAHNQTLVPVMVRRLGKGHG